MCSVGCDGREPRQDPRDIKGIMKRFTATPRHVIVISTRITDEQTSVPLQYRGTYRIALDSGHVLGMPIEIVRTVGTAMLNSTLVLDGEKWREAAGIPDDIWDVARPVPVEPTSARSGTGLSVNSRIGRLKTQDQGEVEIDEGTLVVVAMLLVDHAFAVVLVDEVDGAMLDRTALVLVAENGGTSLGALNAAAEEVAISTVVERGSLLEADVDGWDARLSVA